MASAPQGSEVPDEFVPPERSSDLSGGDIPADDISVLDVLIVVARRRRPIVVFTCAVTVLALVTAFLLPVSYTAVAVILPPQGSSSTGSAVMSQLGSLGAAGSIAGGGLGIKNPNDMYVAMLRARTVVDAMIRRFDLMTEYHAGLMSDARNAFVQHTSVMSGAKDNLITLSVQDKDPRRAAEMANAYIEEYRKFSATLAITEASQRRLFFEDQLQQARDNLARAEEALKKTEQTTGLVQIDSQARALIESAASLRAQIAAKQVEIRGMRSFAAEENPNLQMAEQQLAGWQAQLSGLGGSQTGSGDDLLLAKGQVPGAGLEYMRGLRDVKYYDTVFDLLARQFESAKLDEARQGSLVQVVDAAVTPDRRSSPRRGLIVVVAAVVAFSLGVAWAIVAAGVSAIRRKPQNRERLRTLNALLGRTPQRA